MARADFEITVDSEPDEVLREFVLVLSANPRVTVAQPVAGLLVVDETYVPAVYIMLMILLFPIGLLLLLLKRKRSATVAVDASDRGAEIAVSGNVSQRVADGLYGVAEMLADSADQDSAPDET